MLLRLRTISYLAAAAISSVSCLTSVPTDVRSSVEFLPTIAGDVRSSFSGTKSVEAFDEFGVYAFNEDGTRFMDKERVSYNGEVWISDRQYLWERDNKLRFFAYTPYIQDVEDVLSGGALQLGHYDITTATAPVCYTEVSTPVKKGNGPVVLIFKPATAVIEFRVINGLGADTQLKVEKINLQSICTGGSYKSDDSPEWTLESSRADFNAYTNFAPEDPACIISPLETRYVGTEVNMIPQQPVAGIEIVFSQRSGQSEWLTGQRAVTKELEAEWEAGRRYTYTLTVTGADTVSYTLGLGNWASRQ